MNDVLVVGLPEAVERLVCRALHELEPALSVACAPALDQAITGCQLLLGHADVLRGAAPEAGPAVVVLAPEAAAADALTTAERLDADLILWPAAPDLAFSQQVRRAARVGLARGRLAQRSADHLNLLQVQQTLIRGAAAGADLAAVLQLTVGLIHRRLHHEMAAIYLLEPATNRLALGAIAGAPLDLITAAAYHVGLGQGAAGQAADLGCPVQDTEIGEPQAGPLPLEAGPLAAALGVPIVAGARRLGALVVIGVDADAVVTHEELRHRPGRAGR
ncbi:MAG: GAF domain-containing protein [Anaerolineales bacterium]|nr:GAF domain-containing protein [Anaerolineales bacterium]